MTVLGSILAFILGNKAILGFVGAVLAGLGWGFHQRLAGAKAERAKQSARDAKAVQDAMDVQNDIGTLTPEQARKELSIWDM